MTPIADKVVIMIEEWPTVDNGDRFQMIEAIVDKFKKEYQYPVSDSETDVLRDFLWMLSNADL